MKKLMWLFGEHVELLDFNELLQNSSDDLIWDESLNLTFVTWEGDNPTCIEEIQSFSKYEIKTLDDFNNLPLTEKWSYYITQ